MFHGTDPNAWEEIRRLEMSIVCFLLLLLPSLSKQDGQQTGILQCGPQNLTVRGSDHQLQVEWEDDISCSAMNYPILYKMTVLIENKEVHTDEILVKPEDIQLTHSWNWTSYLPLECASHTIRLKSQINNHTGQMELQQTLHGATTSDKAKVLPDEVVLKVGNIATFCCIVPEGKTFIQILLRPAMKTNMNRTRISAHRHALTLQLEEVWNRSVDVECETEEPDGVGGASIYIGYPPDVRNLQCETRDLESVQCTWDEGRDTMLGSRSPTYYQLNGSNFSPESPGRLYKKFKVIGGMQSWTLTAWNTLGKVEINYQADLTQRVHMWAPERLTAADVNARNATLTWKWKVPRYHNLNLTCHILISDSEGQVCLEKHGVGLNGTALTDLRPNWNYNLTVRCQTANHSILGDWSKQVTFLTKGDVPDALDVWMKRQEKHTLIVWKEPLNNQSHGNIIKYEVTWANTTFLVNHSINRYSLLLDPSKEHVVTVTAINEHGISSPSTITIPVISPEKNSINTSWITGSAQGLSLSWSASQDASCGYIVDWVPAVHDGDVDWLKLPPNQTRVKINPEKFLDGLRYSLSIYACTTTSPVLLEKREGYITETRIKGGLFNPLEYKQMGTDVEISWKPVPVKEQSAFIRGYVLYCHEKSGKNIQVTTDNPEETSLMVKNLMISSYNFTVVARTAVGECGNTSITATLNPENDSFHKTFFISLSGIFILILLIAILCYRQWAHIPKPEIANWLTSPVKDISLYLQTDPSLHSEDRIEIPQLVYKSEEPIKNNIHQDKTQAPQGYQNTPHPNWTANALDGSNPKSLPLSLFPNPTYNLLILKEGMTPGTEPKLQVRNEYQPQSLNEIFHQNQVELDPKCFVPDYIVAPKPSFSQ
ncbi:oncostatin-M-specific receptor subunit beta-like [Cyprinodon tularosa]|uniref:oncostatin-M-specific receptor subunit beta-like n=1 Tax=Cyprinodon tularosa TaxID=77115 RepID=UPI0018E266D4|nr:oncostatin-M-specific receptor subunit beta-like [Cyprinodon tularosa]